MDNMSFIPVKVDYEQYLNLNNDGKILLLMQFFEQNRGYVKNLYQRDNSAWFIISATSGKIYKSGNDIRDFPQVSDLEKVVNEKKDIIFTYRTQTDTKGLAP